MKINLVLFDSTHVESMLFKFLRGKAAVVWRKFDIGEVITHFRLILMLITQFALELELVIVLVQFLSA
jgi:hypothetical protein